MAIRILDENKLFNARGHRNQIVHRAPLARLPQFVLAAARPAVSGQFSFIQLFNPVGSGKEIIATGLGVQNGTSTAASIRVGWTATVMTTSVAPAYSTHGSTTSASPVGQVRVDTNASATAFGMTPTGGWLKKTFPASDAIHERDCLREWETLTIPAGVGLLLVQINTNLELQANLRWVEVDA